MGGQARPTYSLALLQVALDPLAHEGDPAVEAAQLQEALRGQVGHNLVGPRTLQIEVAVPAATVLCLCRKVRPRMSRLEISW